MSVTLQKFPITVKATADWSVAANAWADIEPVLMDILPVTFPLNAAITFVILETDLETLAGYVCAYRMRAEWACRGHLAELAAAAPT